MPKELEGYRDNLERIHSHFPNRELLTRKDVCEFTGLSRPALANNYPFKGKYISKSDFARMITKQR
jgi:hypothetical protein